MAHTEQELTALTAKALRPIAAALNITGTSRMVKADIVSAIIKAEAALEIGTAVEESHGPTRADRDHTTALHVNDKIDQIGRLHRQGSPEARSVAYDLRDELLHDGFTEQALNDYPPARARHVAKDLNLMVNFGSTPPLQQTPRKMPYGGHWSMSFPLARGGDGNVMQGHVDYCAAWGHATETHDGVVSGHCPRCGALPKAEVPAMLCPHGIDARRRCSICAEDTAEGVPPVLTPASIVLNETITRDDDYTGHWAGTAYITHHTYGRQIHRDVDSAQRWNAQQRDLRPAEDPNADEYDARMAATQEGETSVPEYFARRTRRGVETVVLERVHAGRVNYRIIDAKTGRRSASYGMRELTFYTTYVKVPS